MSDRRPLIFETDFLALTFSVGHLLDEADDPSEEIAGEQVAGDRRRVLDAEHAVHDTDQDCADRYYRYSFSEPVHLSSLPRVEHLAIF